MNKRESLAPPPSTVSESGSSCHDENIKIYLRIRPFTALDAYHGSAGGGGGGSSCIRILDPSSGSVQMALLGPSAGSLGSKPITANSTGVGGSSETFSYDCLGAPEATQEQVFRDVGRTITDNCLQGYNGTIFAYGQTGSGKTFTMMGATDESGCLDRHHRGMIPRILEYLFVSLAREEKKSLGSFQYLVKCSMVEIYNEVIYDLLDPTTPVCALREDMKQRGGGVYVDGHVEELITCPEDALRILETGSRNRHVASTSMNRESSRSHCLFTLFIQCRSLDAASSLTDLRESRFHLVDLAGSERQQLTGTTGLRLKEAGNINKSLLALSNVMNALVDVSNGKPRHVQYRDSKLTFLLKDSLGGNAKTFIIANVSPSPASYAETLSTLRFAQRAKQIRNKAIVNKDTLGNVGQLQAEIKRLKDELALAKLASSASTNAHNAVAGGEDGYFRLFRAAVERQLEAERESESTRQRLAILEDLCRRREQQVQSEKMIVRLRDSTIQSLKKQLGTESEGPDPAHEEKECLRSEIAELQKLVEHHPEVTRFAYENIALQDRLSRVETYLSAQQSHEQEKNARREYERELSKQILVLAQQLESRGESSCSPALCQASASSDVAAKQLEHAKLEKEKWSLELAALRSEIDKTRRENALLQTVKDEVVGSLEELKKSMGSAAVLKDVEISELKAALQAREALERRTSLGLSPKAEALKEECDRLRHALREKQAKLDDAEECVCRLESHNASLVEEREQWASQRSVVQHEHEALTAEHDTLVSRVLGLQSELQASEYACGEACAALQASCSDLATKEAALIQSENEVHRLELQLEREAEKLGAMALENHGLNDENHFIRNELEIYAKESNQLKNKVALLESQDVEKRELQHQLSILNDQKLGLATRLDKLSAELEAMVAERSEQKAYTQDLVNKLSCLKSQTRQLELELLEKTGSLDTLSEEARHNEVRVCELEHARQGLVAEKLCSERQLLELALEMQTVKTSLDAALTESMVKSQELESINARWEATLTKLQESKQGLESALSACQKSLAATESEHASLQQAYSAVLESKAKDQKTLLEENRLLMQQKKQLEEECHGHQKQSSQLLERQGTLAKRVQELESALQERADSMAQIKQENTRLRAAMASTSNEVSQLGLKAQTLKTELVEKEREAAHSQKRERALVEQHRELEASIRELRSRLADEELAKRKLEFKLKSAIDDNEELLSQLEATGSGPGSRALELGAALASANEKLMQNEKEMAALVSELDSVRAENDKLIQHQNMKQKLQYHVKIKKENNELKEEMTALREELLKLQGRASEGQEKENVASPVKRKPHS